MPQAIWLLGLVILSVILIFYYRHSRRPRHPIDTTNFYDLTIRSIDGGVIKFSSFAGKKVLIVNTASQSEFTEQYAALQHLYELYQDFLVVLAIPCNQFMQQEPENEGAIRQFCSDNYNITFPMSEKVNVTGPDQHPVYQRLTSKSLNAVRDSQVQRNFQKYLVNEYGQLLAIFPPETKPFDIPEIHSS